MQGAHNISVELRVVHRFVDFGVKNHFNGFFALGTDFLRLVAHYQSVARLHLRVEVFTEHAHKSCLPGSILAKKNNDFRTMEISLLDNEFESFYKKWENWIFCSFQDIWKVVADLLHQSVDKTSTSMFSRNLKFKEVSRNRRFSVGIKPSKNALIPSLTLKGRVTTP